MKEVDTGVYGTYMPNLLVCGVNSYHDAKQMFSSEIMIGDSRKDEGNKNPHFGEVDIIMSPLLAPAKWILMDTTKMGVVQRIAQDFVLSDGGDYSMAKTLSRIYTGSVASEAAFLDSRAFFYGNA